MNQQKISNILTMKEILKEILKEIQPAIHCIAAAKLDYFEVLPLLTGIFYEQRRAKNEERESSSFKIAANFYWS